ncbi:KUP/HAK/KT family potassium transporter [Elizabethkingia meningoseptica]|uniref:Probable potassium transport system protein Kup n=1 Tax=Elizabethkingia meningoseptica TaxID=238 RepID=A0A1V3U4T3_ELIME|nr:MULTISPECIES: KUP/HAK/KT family potassium transporter [Elizabethkingia]AQX03928.1 potassium transporter Kup [Elizabethkingia meningoseptica]AQX11391.1 potassium transporter Kup [Elizabethkingia meningoseptica]AQX45968.1 potassium transporter Kup [Elizabethkingia meningoseptica]EJK5329269.1 KUP/HAK/KT family potassium transporter [Elizabethkingia meningoseptica]EOR29785.1 K+ transporter [Elizabethkingia meningoseptica ATCC 13253 = NBRC 12535]
MLGLNAHIDTKKLTFVGVLVSLGIVFGDIGTSPLYVMKAIVNARRESGTLDPIFLEGALSCIIWTLTIQTTIKYVVISLRADNKGEGGILALFSLVKNLKKKWLYIIAIIGAATLIADGVITPSLTVMAAIEGLEIYNPETPVVMITLIVLIVIFTIQQFGTSFIGKFFGPVMTIWFLMLGILGIMHISDYPHILKALNPYYAVRLIITSPSIIVILGAVFLCTTGAEALYSDLGHCGAKNIRISWLFVKICLILNYLGQGAWLVGNYQQVFAGENPFFAMMPEWFVLPAVIMATAAAIIASQALITGSFTIFSEAMSLNFWPLQEIDYPAGIKGQMYIPKVNWGLLVFCIFVVLYFKESGKMEAAYGLSITVTMLMTTVLLVFYLFKKRINRWLVLLFALVYLSLELGFFSANVIKFFEGGWITVFLAGFIGICMYAWYNGRMIKTKFIKFVKLEHYVSTIQDMKLDETIPKYATNLAYFSRAKDPKEIESKIIYSIIRAQPKRADHYFILNIVNHEDPYTYEYKIDEILPGTIYRIHFILGFKVDRLINDYFHQVLTDMVDEGIIPDRSSHPSLRAHNIPPDLKYVVIDNVYINDYLLTIREKIIMNVYNFVRKMGSSDFTAFGLVSHNVVVESAPLLYNPVREHKIKQVGFNRFDED